MKRAIRRYAAIPAALTAAVLTMGAGCGSDGTAKGHTVVVPGRTPESVTCSETPYDSNAGAKDPHGSGITVSRGLVRGALWVSCTVPGPDMFSITVTLLRNGLPYGSARTYAGIPTATGYSASSFLDCIPGVYRLQYQYKWTLGAGSQGDLNTVSVNRTVTQHDCDA